MNERKKKSQNKSLFRPLIDLLLFFKTIDGNLHDVLGTINQ